MKQINIWFDDKDHKKLKDKKESLGLTWRDFLLVLIKGDKNETTNCN